MYPFVYGTWNPIRGICPHECDYCYMNDPKLKPRSNLHLERREFKEKPGENKFYFMGSSCDMWLASKEEIDEVLGFLRHCWPNNVYLFQTKNPSIFFRHMTEFPPHTVLGITIESNRNYKKTEAPDMLTRMAHASHMSTLGYRILLSMEPIMEFDLDIYLAWIKNIQPEAISIGANTAYWETEVREPRAEWVKRLYKILIKEYPELTIIIKKNLERLGVYLESVIVNEWFEEGGEVIL